MKACFLDSRERVAAACQQPEPGRTVGAVAAQFRVSVSFVAELLQATPAERQVLADAIARMSPVSWQRINLQGEFDFSDEALTDALRFDLSALLTVEWEAAEGE